MRFLIMMWLFAALMFMAHAASPQQQQQQQKRNTTTTKTTTSSTSTKKTTTSSSSRKSSSSSSSTHSSTTSSSTRSSSTSSSVSSTSSKTSSTSSSSTRPTSTATSTTSSSTRSSLSSTITSTSSSSTRSSSSSSITTSSRSSGSSSSSSSRSSSSSTSSTSSACATSTGRYVMAHYMVGNAASYSTSDWQDDMTQAQNAGIDAFGLNIAAEDPYTSASLATAFAAAESLSGRTIKLYLNFDYEAWGTWDESNVISLINEYKTSTAYFNYSCKPFVSTFEGTGNIADWTTIKNSTNCFFMPDWSSLGAATASSYSVIDGLASWDAWPTGPTNMTTGDDAYYISELGSSKPYYMMPVSPWFYTNLPAYSKNWLWHSDSLWHTRWLQAISLLPEFIQIISWNDYGESHYIGPIRTSGVVSGAWYVDSSHPHTAWTTLLPYYISAYKSGSQSPLNTAASTEKLVYWYKSNPVASGGTDSTVCDNASYQTTYTPSTCSNDAIFFTMNLASASTISLTIGGNSTGTQSVYAGSAGINHFSLATNAQTGTPVFTVSRSGSTVFTVSGSTAITTDTTDGYVNWNPVVGSN